MNAPARSCRRLVLFLAAVVLGAGGFARADEPADAAAPAVLRPGDALLVRIDPLGGGLPEYREVIDSDGNVARGVSVRSPADQFNRATGRRIALARARQAMHTRTSRDITAAVPSSARPRS